MTYRVRNVVIAVALAAVAALLTSFYVTSYKRHVQRGQDKVTVLVAKQDIQQGTTGSEAAKLLGSKQVLRDSVVPGAVTTGVRLLSGIASDGQTSTTELTRHGLTPHAQRWGRYHRLYKA